MSSWSSSSSSSSYFHYIPSYQNRLDPVDLTEDSKDFGGERNDPSIEKRDPRPNCIDAVENQVIKEKLVTKKTKQRAQRGTDEFRLVEIDCVNDFKKRYDPCFDPKLSLNTTGVNSNLFMSFEGKWKTDASGNKIREVISKARPFMSPENQPVIIWQVYFNISTNN